MDNKRIPKRMGDVIKCGKILEILNQMAPLANAEDFDNVGLLVGDRDAEITGILVCHDALESVIDEAINNSCNLIVAFHPIIFSGLKSITGKNYVERAVIKAIRNNIGIYAVHTALDNHENGVNKILCAALGLVDTKILLPKKNNLRKLVTYAPEKIKESLSNALFDAGAGNIGNYNECSFVSKGIGTFRGNEKSSPVIGEKGVRCTEVEVKIEMIFEKRMESKILKALFENHSYEEVAYEIYEIQNDHQNVGLGMIGTLPEPMNVEAFLEHAKSATMSEAIRHGAKTDKKISRVAVLGGSGGFAIKAALNEGAEAFITSDLKYHDFFEADGKMLLVDVGHYESERGTKRYIVDFLTKKLPNFAIILSKENTNPVKYL